jgi:glucose/arabinose dehydrogenase
LVFIFDLFDIICYINYCLIPPRKIPDHKEETMKASALFHKLIGLALIFLVILTGQVRAQSQGNDSMTIFLPIIRHASGLALPPSDLAAERLSVPDGFAIRYYATQVGARPRLMTIGQDGSLYVALYGGGAIVRLADANQDGLADGKQTVLTGLSTPHNVEWFDGWMYVAEGDKISRHKDTNGDGYYETHETVTTNIPGSGGHNTRTLHFGPDGKLYVSVGSTCNACDESDPRRAAILRFNPDGSIPGDNPFHNDPDPRKQPLWAWGLRNSVDFLWAPNGELWADHNGSDGLGDNLPPEEIVIPVQGNRWHGWPYCYTATTGANTSPEILVPGGSLPAGLSCSDAVPARFTDLAHSAPLGMHLGAPAPFPAAYQFDLYVAFHGSWNTTLANARDCKIQRIRIQSGIPVGSETFVNGWRAPGETCSGPNAFGRPADVVINSAGEMFISDDVSNAIYRVIYIGQ